MIENLAIVDTDVFSAVLAPRRDDIRPLYEEDLIGRKLAISFQTAAELRYGALAGGWGTKRIGDLESRIEQAITVPPTDALTVEWAKLRNECKRAGHALHQKEHTGDLWVAATARLLDVPLIAHDRVYQGVPDLTVISHS